MFVLWKDHTAVAEAEENKRRFQKLGRRRLYEIRRRRLFIRMVLGQDSPCAEGIPRGSGESVFVGRHCDWVPAVFYREHSPLLIKRSRCAAGHKAMWHSVVQWAAPGTYLVEIDRRLAGLRERLF